MSADVVTLARGWIGTPYRHGASVRGAGADCLGLIRGVWAQLGLPPMPPVPPYTPDWSEHDRRERLWDAARAHLTPRPLDDPRPGDVLLMRMAPGAVAKHLAILTCPRAPAIVHAWSRRGVVETPLAPVWRRAVVARFAYPHRKD
ncbi:MAG: NlpC/P60 family protein [Paracoccaceae bacterium]